VHDQPINSGALLRKHTQYLVHLVVRGVVHLHCDEKLIGSPAEVGQRNPLIAEGCADEHDVGAESTLVHDASEGHRCVRVGPIGASANYAKRQSIVGCLGHLMRLSPSGEDIRQAWCIVGSAKMAMQMPVVHRIEHHRQVIAASGSESELRS